MTTIPAPRTELAPLNLVAVERVHSLSQRAVWPLLSMLGKYLDEYGPFDHATFMVLADEAEASVKP